MRAHPAGPRHGDTVTEHETTGPPADLSALDPVVWPATAHRDPASGAVVLGGVPVTELASEWGTPVYLLDEADLAARMAAWAAAWPDGQVYYAAKAFLCTAMAHWVAGAGLGLDVCTGGEMAVAHAAGFPPARMLLHGSNKSLGELDTAVSVGVGRVVLDSFVEIDRVAEVAAAAGVVQAVLVRVTVGVEAHTHEYIATAHEDQKFGFSLADGDAAEAVRRVLAAPSLRLVGLHSHIGSQIFDTAGFEVAAHRVVGLAAAVRDEHGLELPELNLGGGLGVAYVSGDDPMPPAQVAERLRRVVAAECAAADLAVPAVAVEPGRAIVGPAGVTLYEVGTVKAVSGLRTYVSVDGGMSDNIRTALYDADYTAVLANRVSDAAPLRCRVVGRHCESGDVVVRDTFLPADVAPGDLLAVPATGAYCRSMSSTYNHVGRPPVVAVGAGLSRVVVRRETMDDLLALDAPGQPGPLRSTR